MPSHPSFTPLTELAEGDSSKPSRRVAYFYDPDVGNYSYFLGHPMKPHRIRMTHNLVTNYGLCDEEILDAPEAVGEGSRTVNGVESDMDVDQVAEARMARAVAEGPRGKGMQVFRPRRARPEDMTRFHSDEYIEFLEEVTPETAEALTGGGVRCLIGEDCPAFEGVFEFCSISAGGSICAAEKLNSGAADIAINWAGGLHHAKKTEASGFCYINDIVLGILELLRTYPRVLYIDCDVHHGDGVEEAFYTTDRVMTCSFHRFGEFFPGTGDVRDVGMKRGKGYAVNVPLRDGITDESFHSIFKPVIKHIMDFYRPGAVVLQMGADSLAGDKLGGFNVSLEGHAECARYIKSFDVPVMMLGGGGYTIKNVAKAWTKETAIMVGRDLPEDLPYNHYMEYFGPRYKLEVLQTNVDDHNPPEYLEAIKRTIFENLRDLPFAPSAQIKAVPGKSLSQVLGLNNVDDDPDHELDTRIKKLMARRQNLESDSDSDDDSAFARPARARRQGGFSLRPNPRSRLLDPMPASKHAHGDDDDEDDHDHGRKKRSFFVSKAGDCTWDPKSVLGPIVANGADGVNGGISSAASASDAVKRNLVPGEWVPSRAASPASVM
ncbi:hypothetical protein Q5752_005120 [Cryptotrichosporon argae]